MRSYDPHPDSCDSYDEVATTFNGKCIIWKVWMDSWDYYCEQLETNKFLEKDKCTARGRGSRTTEATTSTDHCQLMKMLGHVKNHFTYLSQVVEMKLRTT
jgi:hypothetical protein